MRRVGQRGAITESEFGRQWLWLKLTWCSITRGAGRWALRYGVRPDLGGPCTEITLTSAWWISKKLINPR